MEVLVITGLSGAGKSEVLNVLEDRGFYCMDNLPPALLLDFVKLFEKAKRIMNKVAIVLDIRSGYFFDDLFENLDVIEERGFKYKILFLDSRDSILIKRFKEHRRPHPLNMDGSIIDGIRKEREILQKVKMRADYIIDTSDILKAQLQHDILNIFLDGKESKKLVVSIVSFGFKKGIPLDLDMLFDVRFLPNPYYIEELKEFTGNDKCIQDYVMQWDEAKEFFDKLKDMIEFLIPYYTKEGKTQLIIGIACTGGKHRSVTLANELYKYLKGKNFRTTIEHRDVVSIKDEAK